MRDAAYLMEREGRPGMALLLRNAAFQPERAGVTWRALIPDQHQLCRALRQMPVESRQSMSRAIRVALR